MFTNNSIRNPNDFCIATTTGTIDGNTMIKHLVIDCKVTWENNVQHVVIKLRICKKNIMYTSTLCFININSSKKFLLFRCLPTFTILVTSWGNTSANY